MNERIEIDLGIIDIGAYLKSIAASHIRQKAEEEAEKTPVTPAAKPETTPGT